jgi:hypothetical protein
MPEGALEGSEGWFLGLPVGRWSISQSYRFDRSASHSKPRSGHLQEDGLVEHFQRHGYRESFGRLKETLRERKERFDQGRRR